MFKRIIVFLSILIQCISLNAFAGEIPGHNDEYLMNSIKKYEKFGPKVPGSIEHKHAGDWIVKELKSFNLTVKEQKTVIRNHKGKDVYIRNIIAQYNPKANRRYMFSAHWDNRPVADKDTVNKHLPILGANDGGSGVVVLLSMAKRINFFKDKKVGVDFIFFDAEDMGDDSDLKSFCLGSQYWAEHVFPKEYLAEFAINYNMVGRKDASFPIDGVTKKLGEKVINRIQKSAKELKLEKYFPLREVGAILDDHVFVARLSYPVMDIIDLDSKGNFFPEWHTHNDTSAIISLETLNAVMDVSLNLIKNEIYQYNKEKTGK